MEKAAAEDKALANLFETLTEATAGRDCRVSVQAQYPPDVPIDMKRPTLINITLEISDREEDEEAGEPDPSAATSHLPYPIPPDVPYPLRVFKDEQGWWLKLHYNGPEWMLQKSMGIPAHPVLYTGPCNCDGCIKLKNHIRQDVADREEGAGHMEEPPSDTP